MNMNDIQTEPLLLETDGPATCIWKVMAGKDWLTSTDVLQLLRDAGCQYAVTTLRNKLFAMARHHGIESKEAAIQGSYGNTKTYRLPRGKSMPDDLDKTSRKAPAAKTKAEEVKEARRKETMAAAVDHVSAMMMAFVKPKTQPKESHEEPA
jgi:hypothetical protein